MQFNSFAFFVFASIFFILWPLFKRRNNSRWLFLVIASFIFYGWWDWRFLFLILISGLIDYLVSLGIHYKPNHKKIFLITSLCGNLGMLFIFKYSSFVASNLELLLSQFNLHISLESRIPEFCLILPVGISFYTFQSLSYTIDVYKGKLPPTHNPLHFFAYLAMFPQLVAGPIVRASDLLVQLETDHTVSIAQRWDGTRRIIYGFFKKVIIADNLAMTIEFGFDSQLHDHSSYWWLIIIAFSIQIYCDFSGYSDIAIGLASWMGLRFQDNFNYPYLSRSLKEFWQRWHISLSSWFRDYVYISLGGNRDGVFLGHIRLWITMLLCGLWHGAAWNFIAWGAVHAVFLSIERIFKITARIKPLMFGSAILWILTMTEVMVAWVFFRARNLNEALQILTNMFSFTGPLMPQSGRTSIVYICIFIVFELCVILNAGAILRGLPRIKYCIDIVFWALVAVFCIYFRGPDGQFIYFQF